MLGKKAARLATAALLVGAVMGAQQVSGATSPRAHAAASGVIVMTDWQSPDGCGDGSGGTVVDASVCNAMFDSFFNINEKGTYIPDLVESIPTLHNGGAKIVGGNVVVTYKLKPNLKWSDGAPLTVDDWIFSVNLMLAEGNTFGVDQIKSMQKIDDRTVQVTMKGTYATFVENAQPSYFVPKHYFEKKYGSTDIAKIATANANDPYTSPNDVVSGPYKVQTWANDGSTVVLVPNPNYTANAPAAGHPLAAQIKYVNITASESALAADLGSANAGVDKAEDFQYNDLSLLNNSKYHINIQPSLEFEHLELNTKAGGPLADMRVRQALQYAIDKRSLFRQVFPAVPAGQTDNYLLHSLVPNVSPWANKSLPVSDYNPAKAKALLQAAGYSTSYNGPGRHVYLHFYTTTATPREKDGQVLSKQWAAVGIHTLLNFVRGSGNNGLFSPFSQNGVLHQRRFDVGLFAYEISPDPQVYETFFDPKLIPTRNHDAPGTSNYVGAPASAFQILLSARYATDSNQRHAIVNRWLSYMHDQVYWIMLYNRANITADDGHIGNFKPNPTSAGNTWNAFQLYRQ